MMLMTVTKKFDFCYGHCLPGYDGPCKRMHGHNSILEVEIGKPTQIPTATNFAIDPGEYQGMVADFSKLKDVVKEKVIDVLDHQYLNEILPNPFLPPTAENIVRWVWITLKKHYGDALVRIRVYETPTSYAELKREG